MSLDFELGGIENWRDVCFREEKDSHLCRSFIKIIDGKKYWLAPETDVLIWASIPVGIPHIKDIDVAKKFFSRMRLIEVINGSYLITPGKKGKDRPYKFKDVVEHIGLRTNVSPRTDAQFFKIIKSMAKENLVGKEIREYLKERSKNDNTR